MIYIHLDGFLHTKIPFLVFVICLRIYINIYILFYIIFSQFTMYNITLYIFISL